MPGYAESMASRTATELTATELTATELTHPGRPGLRFTAVLAALGDPARLAIAARLADAGPGGELACTTFALPVSKSPKAVTSRSCGKPA